MTTGKQCIAIAARETARRAREAVCLGALLGTALFGPGLFCLDPFGAALPGPAGLFAAEPAAASPVPLNPEATVLLDKPNQRLLLKTKVCLRQGLLEMFLCPRQTKEHESIVAIDARAHVIHAGLLALGAQPGHPAKFSPEFLPPQGQTIDIWVAWTDEEGQPQRRKAQEWVRHATQRYFEAPLETLPQEVVLDGGDDSLRYDKMNRLLLWFGTMTKEQKGRFLMLSAREDFQKAVKSLFEQGQPQQMDAEFVFAGSAFARDDEGKEIYLAQAGSVICVANFGDALIDVNISSTASNDSGLLFEPWTERIPEIGTEVIVELTPRKQATPAETPESR